MIDTEREELLTLSKAAAAVPVGRGRKPHSSTIWRWCHVGIAGVRLDHVRIGRSIYTSKEALNRFYNDVAAATLKVADAVRPRRMRSETQKRRVRSDQDRNDAINRAEASLREEGI